MNLEELKNRCLQGEHLTESEIETLLWESEQIDEIDGQIGRWDQDISTIINLDGRYFEIEWFRGLTENQDNSFPYQPFEVRQETITITKNIYIKI